MKSGTRFNYLLYAVCPMSISTMILYFSFISFSSSLLLLKILFSQQSICCDCSQLITQAVLKRLYQQVFNGSKRILVCSHWNPKMRKETPYGIAELTTEDCPIRSQPFKAWDISLFRSLMDAHLGGTSGIYILPKKAILPSSFPISFCFLSVSLISHLLFLFSIEPFLHSSLSLR